MEKKLNVLIALVGGILLVAVAIVCLTLVPISPVMTFGIGGRTVVFLGPNDGIDVGDTTVNNRWPITVSLNGETLYITPTNGTDWAVTMDGEAIVLGAGSAEVGSLYTSTNTIGDVNVLDLQDGAGDSVMDSDKDAMNVATQSSVISVTLTLSDTVYAAGDLLAETQALTASVRTNGGTAVWYGLRVVDYDDQGANLKVYAFSGPWCSWGTENAAVSVADNCADQQPCMASVTSYEDLGGVQYAEVAPTACVLEAASGADDLYFAVESEGTGTYTANGLVLYFHLLLD